MSLAYQHEVDSCCAGGITRLGLAAFRNYESFALNIQAAQIVLTGANGVGKTNILEAISLLSPGRGLRNARPTEWRQQNTITQWGISARFEDDLLLGTRGIADKPQSQRRTVSQANNNLPSQAALAEYAAIVWLTPQMDGLFLDDASSRRKFIDRLVYAVHPDHAVRLHRYEHALRQRNRLLKEKANNALIESLHPILVAEGVAIAAARLEITEQLNVALGNTDTAFSTPHLQWQGHVEHWLQHGSAVLAEQQYQDGLSAALNEDRIIGQTRLGVHRSDVLTTHRQKNIAASHCSTGEQKALLLSLVLAHAHWLKTIQPNRPLIILLDDVAAHLDEDRRRDVFEWTQLLSAQTWFTGTDADMFAPMQNTAQHIHLPL